MATGKVRIFELAKELGMTSKDLLALFGRLRLRLPFAGNMPVLSEFRQTRRVLSRKARAPGRSGKPLPLDPKVDFFDRVRFSPW